jgi:iron complex outermembrane receptor protein
MTRTLLRYSGAILLFVSTLTGADMAGTVADPQRRPVADARLTLTHRETGRMWETATDDAGQFLVRGLPAGEYLVLSDAPGLSSPPRVIALSETGSLDIAIALDHERVRSEVTVTASATAQSTVTISRSLDVVRREDWEDRGVSSVSDAIQLLPGVRTQNLGGPGSFTRFNIRGTRGQDAAITIDGMRFRDAGTTQGDATSFLENLMLVNADRVEVLRGSGSALYGTNAIGGVVNLVSDTGGDRHHGSVLAEGGGLGFARGLIRFSGPITSTWGYSAGVQHTNVSSGVDGQDPFRNSSVQGTLTWRPRPGMTLSGRLLGADAFTSINDTAFAAPAARLPARGVIRAVPISLSEQRAVEAGAAPVFGGGANLVPSLNDPDYHRGSRYAATAVQIIHQLTPRFVYRASYQNLFTRRLFEDGPAGVRFEPLFRAEDRFRGQTDTVQTRADWLLSSKITIGGGYEWEREDYQSRSSSADPASVISGVTAGAHSHAGFGFLEARLAEERLHISLAGRLQAFRVRLPGFRGGAAAYAAQEFPKPPQARTVDAGVAWFFASTRTKLRAHAGNGYRAPSVFERFGVGYFQGVFTPYGDPRLTPDRTVSLDAGLDQYVWSDRLRLSAVYFYTDLREVILFDSSGFLNSATDPYQRGSGYINTGGAIARGAETQVEAALPRGIHWRGSYTYTHAVERRSTVRDRDFFRTSLITPHLFSSSMTAPVTRRLDLTASVWVTGNHANILSSRAFLIDGARRVDLTVSYRLPFERTQLSIQAKASNLFDHQYIENGFRTPGRWGTIGLQLRY